jgi:hypothetical protein
MALATPQSPASTSRPSYLDDLFRSQPTQPLPRTKTPSIRSHGSRTSSTSSATLDARFVQTHTRPLSPAFEEDHMDDRSSVRSLKLTLSPRAKLRSVFRNTYPQVKETVDYESDLPQDRSSSRRPSLPKLHTAFTAFPAQQQKSHRRQSKPLPPPPRPQPEGLSSQKCYYFVARNCNGYVMGGSHGDACESCAVSVVQSTSQQQSS